MVRTYLIIEPDPVVNLDLVSTIKAVCPKTAVLIAQSTADAERTVRKGCKDLCVLVSTAVASARAIAFLKDVAVSGGRVIFVGRLLDVDFPATAIETPFTTQMVVEAVRNDVLCSPARLPVPQTKRPA